MDTSTIENQITFQKQQQQQQILLSSSRVDDEALGLENPPIDPIEAALS
jgi:hypothetical protein